MTPDQAIAIRVRLDTAIMSLEEAQGQLPSPIGEDDTAGETINESIEDALSACRTALQMARSVIGV